MTTQQRIHILTDALRRIADIAVEPGDDPMVALLDAQRIADEARSGSSVTHPGKVVHDGKVLPFKPIGLKHRV